MLWLDSSSKFRGGCISDTAFIGNSDDWTITEVSKEAIRSWLVNGVYILGLTGAQVIKNTDSIRVYCNFCIEDVKFMMKVGLSFNRRESVYAIYFDFYNPSLQEISGKELLNFCKRRKPNMDRIYINGISPVKVVIDDSFVANKRGIRLLCTSNAIMDLSLLKKRASIEFYIELYMKYCNSSSLYYNDFNYFYDMFIKILGDHSNERSGLPKWFLDLYFTREFNNDFKALENCINSLVYTDFCKSALGQFKKGDMSGFYFIFHNNLECTRILNIWYNITVNGGYTESLYLDRISVFTNYLNKVAIPRVINLVLLYG